MSKQKKETSSSSVNNDVDNNTQTNVENIVEDKKKPKSNFFKGILAVPQLVNEINDLQNRVDKLIETIKEQYDNKNISDINQVAETDNKNAEVSNNNLHICKQGIIDFLGKIRVDLEGIVGKSIDEFNNAVDSKLDEITKNYTEKFSKLDELLDLAEENKEQKTILQQKDEQINAAKAECANLLVDKDEQINAAKAECANLLADKDEQINAVKAECENLLADKDAEINALKAECENLLADKDAEINALKAECVNLIADKDAEINALKAECVNLIADKDELLNAAKAECANLIADKDEQIDTLKAECEKLLNLLEEKEQTILNIQSEANDYYTNLSDVSERNNELISQTSSLKNELDSFHDEYKDFIVYSRIDSVVEQLHSNVNLYYSSSDTIYGNASDIKQGSDKLKDTIYKIIESSEPNKKEAIRKELISKLSPNNWINAVIRLTAYTKVETFNISQAIKMDILHLGKLICDLYNKFDIELVVPNLLKEDYDSEKYDYGNNETTWITYFCNNINPAEYRGKVFDIIKIGYNVYNNDGTHEQCKPVVFYY